MGLLPSRHFESLPGLNYTVSQTDVLHIPHLNEHPTSSLIELRSCFLTRVPVEYMTRSCRHSFRSVILFGI